MNEKTIKNLALFLEEHISLRTGSCCKYVDEGYRDEGELCLFKGALERVKKWQRKEAALAYLSAAFPGILLAFIHFMRL